MSLADSRRHNESAVKNNTQPLINNKYVPLVKDGANRKKVTMKHSISNPIVESFVHVTGVRPSNQGLQITDYTDNVDPRLRKLLQVAGLNENILANPKQRAEIYAFVNKNDVLQNVDVKSILPFLNFFKINSRRSLNFLNFSIAFFIKQTPCISAKLQKI